VRYLGSKTSIAGELVDLISPGVGATFCDPFGGIATVSAVAKRRGCEVVTGDILSCPYSFQIARIAYSRRPSFRRLRRLHQLDGSGAIAEHLNRQRAATGWLIDEFSVKRHFFTRSNAEAIEGVRREIGRWLGEDALTSGERAYLVASLVNSMDRVANTAGTYYAYLKGLSRKATRPFRLELLTPVTGLSTCRAYLVPAAELVESQEWDVLYLDPPYNERNYAGYYHLPETVSRMETPPCYGSSGSPAGAKRPRSDFNRPSAAVGALENVLNGAKARKVVFHYSADGLIPLGSARDLLSQFGSVEEHVLTALGYTTQPHARQSQHVVLVASNG
jgi:adenine-specific DNA-methyltransferase